MPKQKASPTKKQQSVIPGATDSQPLSKRISRKNLALIILFLLIALFWKFKSNFIVAMVNGQPILRWQLNEKMAKKFGEQTLDTIINERLILAAARQKGIFVKAEEIDIKKQQIETRLNGKINLDDALKAQGLTVDDFKRELEIQISIEKLFDKESTVSSAEIEEYMNKNSQTYKTATDPAAVKEEIETIIRQQKINDSFEKWFDDLRKNAKITKFL